MRFLGLRIVREKKYQEVIKKDRLATLEIQKLMDANIILRANNKILMKRQLLEK